MKIFNLRRTIATGVLAGLALAAPALAVVESKLPIEKLYGGSGAVLVGKVEKLLPANSAAEISLSEALAGQVTADRIRVVIKDEAALKDVAEGQPVVLMPSRASPSSVILHVGNRWLRGQLQPGTKVPLYSASPAPSDYAHTYPGRTTRLIDILREVKDAKKSNLPDKTDPRVLGGEFKKLGKLPVANATAAMALDDAPSGKPLLAVAFEGGMKVFALKDGEWVPSTSPVFLRSLAVTDVAKESVGGTAKALVGGAFGEKDEPSALVVRNKGIYRESLEGAPTKLPADDLFRLSGDAAKTYFPAADGAGIAAAAMTTMDVNADGRPDVVILTDEACVALVSRGYGAFFVIPRIQERLKVDGKPAFAVAGTQLAAADVDGDKRQDLLAITADGTVWALLNPQPK